MFKRWRSWRYHMAQYHGYRQMWMFGQNEADLKRVHDLIYCWCHKPQRDQVIDKLRGLIKSESG